MVEANEDISASSSEPQGDGEPTTIVDDDWGPNAGPVAFDEQRELVPMRPPRPWTQRDDDRPWEAQTSCFIEASHRPAPASRWWLARKVGEGAEGG